MIDLIPRYEMTLTLRIVTLPDGERVLKCDYSTFKKHGYACRHMYKLLESQSSRMQRLDGMMDTVTIMVDTHNCFWDGFDLPEIPIIFEEEKSTRTGIFPIGIGGKDGDHFTCSLGKLQLRESYYWQTVAETFYPITGNVLDQLGMMIYMPIYHLVNLMEIHLWGETMLAMMVSEVRGLLLDRVLLEKVPRFKACMTIWCLPSLRWKMGLSLIGVDCVISR